MPCAARYTGKQYGHKAKPAGPCPNCGAPTRSSGSVTDETRGMARLVTSRGVCSRCEYHAQHPDAIPRKDRPAKPAGKTPPFKWTPELIKEAVDYAMDRLDTGLGLH